MVDFVQDTGYATKGETYKDAADYSYSVSVTVDPQKKDDVAYKLPTGLESMTIREVTKADVPAEWLAKATSSALQQRGLTRDPDFIGISNQKGRVGLFVAWN